MQILTVFYETGPLRHYVDGRRTTREAIDELLLRRSFDGHHPNSFTSRYGTTRTGKIVVRQYCQIS